jgi:hypothetical protein
LETLGKCQLADHAISEYHRRLNSPTARWQLIQQIALATKLAKMNLPIHEEKFTEPHLAMLETLRVPHSPLINTLNM